MLISLKQSESLLPLLFIFYSLCINILTNCLSFCRRACQTKTRFACLIIHSSISQNKLFSIDSMLMDGYPR
jgi:hypothetical protein